MTEKDREEGAFYAAARIVSEHLQNRHGVLVTFREDEEGRLMLHVANMRSVTAGLSIEGGKRVPTMTVHLEGSP